jgi:hypothetical protein
MAPLYDSPISSNPKDADQVTNGADVDVFSNLLRRIARGGAKAG